MRESSTVGTWWPESPAEGKCGGLEGCLVLARELLNVAGSRPVGARTVMVKDSALEKRALRPPAP
jgi:hypothetical protein